VPARAGDRGDRRVSTPQDVALLDARKALSMFNMLKTPVLG
jgi:ATP-binding protein involved in chromosome partitioning